MGVSQREVIHILFCALLEYLISIICDFTEAVLHTPAAEPVYGTVDAVHLHTTIQVYYMVFCIYIIVCSCGTEVPSVHAVGGLVVDTTIGQYRYWLSINIIRVGVKEVVVVTYLLIAHSTICLCLVGVVHNLMVLGRLVVLVCSQDTQLHLLDRLILQLSLEAHVNNIDVNIVVLQFVEDVERSIVASVECVCVQSPR